jgi:hypothetical protein
MPISKDEFNKGRSEDPIIHKIQDFLESNNEKAFTEEEIMRHLYCDAHSGLCRKDRVKICRYRLCEKDLL